MRFLSVKLDKYGVKYNDDKRNGLIGSKKKAKKEDDADKKATTDRKPARAPRAPRKEPVAVTPPAPVAKSEEE